MGAGYVYILENDSLKDMVKIGSTSYSGEERAKKLSSSSAVPTPFKVAYQEYVNDYENFEKTLHRIFDENRVNNKREFFRVSTKNVISVIQKLKSDKKYFCNFHHCVDLLPGLMKKYKKYLKEELVFLQLHQTPNTVYVEYGLCEGTNDLGWKIVSHANFLDFIAEDNGDELFKLEENIEINYKKFINLEPLSLAMCVDIFTDEYIKTLV